MPEGKPANKYIIYGMVILGGVVAIIIGVWLWINQQSPGNLALKQCQDNANQILTQYITQLDAFQKQNNNQPLSQAQNAELQTIFGNYQEAEQTCLNLAAQLQIVDDFWNNIIPIAIAAVIASVGGAIAIGLYKRITSSLAKGPRTPASIANAAENTLNTTKVETNVMTPEEGAANIDQSAERATIYAESDNSTYLADVQRLITEYATEEATLLEIETEVTVEGDIIETFTAESLGLI